MTKVKELTLRDWFYRQADTKPWKRARPGLAATEIHPDLLANGEIPDPFVDDNERKVQWVGEKKWEYKTHFEVTPDSHRAAHHKLVFEGLDTFADVYLNDTEILQAKSMFIVYEVDVKKYLKEGRNELRIHFRNAYSIGKELDKIHGPSLVFNGDGSRVQIRKAQYHYGWDWGPLLFTCGPYRPIRLVSYDSHIDDVYVKVDLNDDHDVDITATLEVESDKNLQLNISVKSSKDSIIFSEQTAVKPGINSFKFTLKKPELWHPVGNGEPFLHDFEFGLIDDDVVVQTIHKKVGFRKVELIQEGFEEQEGTSFYFKVNGIPIYCNGSNWIPAHSFQTALTQSDYTDWLNLMVKGNQNMIRVWGGGYYEQDFFYEECDRLGLLVWHDFMFACGQYPGYKEFIDLVSEEVQCQLKRLRNHCCLTIFAGNNEDYQVAEAFNLEWDQDNHSGDYSKTNFPARTLYENTFPTLMKKFLSDVPYHPGSPWGGKKTSDQTVGDIHQWNVWHGSQEKYQDWYKLGGRFVSEFGMEALPSRKTYEACITDESELYPQSFLVDHHNKADGFERRLALYVMENIKVNALDLDSWIYATQLMQAECLGYAYRCWRREWRGDGQRYAGGAIVWQINDCWPVASWAIIDFYRRPKLGFYSVKRESASVAVGMYRNEKRIGKEPNPIFDYRPVTYTVDIWGVNSTTQEIPATLKVDVYEVESGKKVSSFYDNKVTLKANQSTEIIEALSIPHDVHVVVHSQLLDSNNSLLGSAGDWPQPLKYLKFPNRSISVDVKDEVVTLSTNKPVKGVELLFDKDLFPDDNGFDLFPDTVKEVEVPGLTAKDHVGLRYYQ